MDLLITVSNSNSGALLAPLLRACIRRGCEWQVFLTCEGVRVLQETELAALVQPYREHTIACHDSWQQFGTASECPVTIGSQTNHSEMAGRAKRVLSL